MKIATKEDFARWRADPAAFIVEVLRDPETGESFELTESERRFLAYAFQLDEQGRLRFPELVYAAPKKSGKSTFAAMIVLYLTVARGGRHAEAYCCANDYEQAQGRTFEAVRKIVELCPWLKSQARITQTQIRFPATGATITAIASDYAGAAGANPVVTAFDELWGYVSERAHRLFDEMVPPPTRKIACRLTTTYAGFEGESELLGGALADAGVVDPDASTAAAERLSAHDREPLRLDR
jgi:phage terminase large subunit-like protein